MNMHAQQVQGKSGQNSSETATTGKIVKATKPVRTVADAQRIPAWAAMAYEDGLPPGLMLQTKLTVNQPGDSQEANRVAEQVKRPTDLRTSVADDQARDSLLRKQKAEPSADAV